MTNDHESITVGELVEILSRIDSSLKVRDNRGNFVSDLFIEADETAIRLSTVLVEGGLRGYTKVSEWKRIDASS